MTARSKTQNSKTVSAKAKRPKARPKTLAERLANVLGKATGLPPDASVNHDHYLYGVPKQQ